MISLQNKAKMERMIGRSWMYRGSTSTFNDMVESNGHIILSTSVKAIKIPVDRIEEFIRECLPAEDALPEKTGNNIQLDGSLFTDLSSGLMKSFHDIDTANGEELKIVLQKAKAKTNVANSLITMANTILKAQKGK